MKAMNLDSFFDYLPSLGEEEYYLFYLISRDREARRELGVNVDKVLFRVAERDPRRATEILSAIRERAEIFKVRGVAVRREWVKIMFLLNPVNFVKASRKATARFVESCGEKMDIMKLYHSELARNVDFRIFMLDIDVREREVLRQLKGIRARLVITTRRGFHVHVWKEDVDDPRRLFKLQGVEVKTRDALEYVPLLDQGNFTPQAYQVEDASEVESLLQ